MVNLLRGLVVNKVGNKTISVAIWRKVCYSIHKVNRVKLSSKKFKVHDEYNEKKAGDIVHFSLLSNKRSKTKYSLIK